MVFLNSGILRKQFGERIIKYLYKHKTEMYPRKEFIFH